MPKGILVVETSPASPERDQEYNDWYNDIHLIDVLKLSGFTAARRFRKLDEGGAHGYLAIYEVEADDLKAAQAGLGVAGGDGRLRMTDSLGMDPPPSMTLYEQIYELAG